MKSREARYEYEENCIKCGRKKCRCSRLVPKMYWRIESGELFDWLFCGGKKEIPTKISKEDSSRIMEEVLSVEARWDGPRRPIFRFIINKFTGGQEYLSRWIMNAPINMVVDHINHDTMDNRRENLRIVTPGENSWNRRGSDVDSKTGIRNVYYDPAREKYCVCFRINGRNIHKGGFATLGEAERRANSIRGEVYEAAK